MDLLQHIIAYYTRESHQGFSGAVFGGLLLVAAVLLGKFATPLSLLKGLTIPFLIFGLMVGIAGFGDGYLSRKALPQKMNLYQQDKQAFFKQEGPKVERTHQSWLGIRIFWTVVTIAGIALLFTVKKNYWIGVGLGTLLLGFSGNIEEAISMKFNEKYYHQVLKAAVPDLPDASGRKKQSDSILHSETTKAQPCKNKNRLLNQVFVRTMNRHLFSPEDTNLNDQIKPADSLPVVSMLHAADLQAAQLDDSVAETVLPGYKENMVLPKKKKLLDYYHSDLIQKNDVSQKRCWFSKKYINETQH
jgi:hypothetical protein